MFEMENPKWGFQLALEVTIFIVGLTGNIFVLIIVHKRNARTTIHGTFVTSLAIADLVLLCFDSPVAILRRFGHKADVFNCRIHLTVVTTGYNAGLFTVTSMAIHRCHIVTKPWRPKLKRRAAKIWVSLVWLAAFILVIPLIIVNKITENGNCEDWPSLAHRQAYTVSLLTAQYILPLLITAICYIRIWLFMKNRPVLARNSNLFTKRQVPGEDSTRESVIILKTVAAIVLTFSVLLLPNQVAWMLFDFRNVSYEELWFAADIFTRLHSCTNPVVYGVMNPQYRRNYIAFLSRMLCCRRFRRVAQAPPNRTMGDQAVPQAACIEQNISQNHQADSGGNIELPLTNQY